MRRPVRSAVALVALVLALGSAPTGAHAFGDSIVIRPPPRSFLLPNQGVVSGRIWFYQHQGNYCTPSASRDCTGARYLSSQYHTYMPVGDVKVFVREGETVIGQGVTDANGYFAVSWWAPHGVRRVNFIWTAEHAGGRFAIRTGDGGTWVMWTAESDTRWGTSWAAPQWLGDFSWGGPGAEHPMANVFDGARRMWNDALSWSSTMQNRFTGVEVRTTNNRCATSCAHGFENRIDLDPNAPYQPQGRILHEMGHIASHVGSRDGHVTTCGDYSWGPDANGWSLTGPEWGCAAFEEAISTFLGDAALYGANAATPRTCLSTGECADGWDLERRPASCPTDANRIPLNIARALWDQFDSVADGENVYEGFWVFVDLLDAYPNGSENHAKNEWMDASGGGPDLDGRGSFDWMFHYADRFGGSLFAPFINNCGWMGD